MADVGYLTPREIKDALERLQRELHESKGSDRWIVIDDPGKSFGFRMGQAVLVDTGSGSRVVRLPTPDGLRDRGKDVAIRQYGSGAVTILPPVGHAIDKGSSLVLSGGTAVTIIFLGGKSWMSVGGGGSGWVWAPTAVQTSAYACTAMYELVRCNPAGGAFTVTLPTITSVDVGKMVCIKNVSSSTTAIYAAAASGQSILEPAHETHLSYESQIYCAVSATQWAIVADFYLAAVE